MFKSFALLNTFCLTISAFGLVNISTAGDEVIFESDVLFPLIKEHAHGATIAELPNGDLLAAWFQGNGERWADDVRIMGSRMSPDKKIWSTPFVMADVPEFPDINPVLFLDPQERLWLVWYTVIANQ